MSDSRRDRQRLQDAADKVRREARQGQADHAGGVGPIVPVERYVFVRLLDDLAASVAHLPPSVRRTALELAGEILDVSRD